MPATPSNPLQDFLQRERRSALGGVRLAAGRAGSDGETTLLIGASNLLDKALRRLAAGDEAAASRLVERALGLDVGSAEAIEPGPMAAHVLLVQQLAAFRTAAGGGWLDLVVGLLRDADDPVATELGRALVGLLGEVDATRAEREQVRAVVRDGAAFGDPLLDVPAGPERTAVVLGLLRLALLLRSAD